jgi:hypothetical protein
MSLIRTTNRNDTAQDQGTTTLTSGEGIKYQGAMKHQHHNDVTSPRADTIVMFRGNKHIDACLVDNNKHQVAIYNV